MITSKVYMRRSDRLRSSLMPCEGDSSKRVRIETSPANERTIDVLVFQERVDVLGRHAPSVEKSHPRSHSLVPACRDEIANRSMDGRSLFDRRRSPCANGPDRLIGDCDL